MTQPVNKSLAAMRPRVDPDEFLSEDWDEPDGGNSTIEWDWSFKGIMSSGVAKLWMAIIFLVLVMTAFFVITGIMATGTHAQPAPTTTSAVVGGTTLPPIAPVTGVTREPRPVIEEVGETLDVREKTFTIPALWMPLLGAILSVSLTSLTTRFDARPIVKGVIALAWAGVTAAIQDIISHQGTFQLGALGDIFFVTVTMTLIGYWQIAQPAKLPEKNIFLPRMGLK